MNGIVYYLYHKENGKGYVGKHCRNNLYARFYGHFKAKSILGNALRKYGEEAFNLVQLDTGSSDQELWDKEIYWIDRLETLHPNGYNLMAGGQGSSGYSYQEATKLAYSIAKKGIKWGPQTLKQKLAATEANRIVSKETVQYIRKSHSSVWDLSVELNLSYQTVQRIKKYLVFKNEP